jgi:hypothetical protein
MIPAGTPEAFAQRVCLLCRNHGISITSWWRTPFRNELVGGKPGSQHLIGMAVDLVLDPAIDQRDLLSLIRQLGLHYLEEGDHIHVQAWPAGARVATASPSLSKPPGSPPTGGNVGGAPLSSTRGAPIQSEKI